MRSADEALPSWLRQDEARSMELAPGETAFRQGDSVFAVFLVRSGRVRLRRNLENGSTVALHTAQEGETFAEAAVSAAAYHCDAVAEAPSALAVFPIDPLRRRLRQDPAAAYEFAMFLAGQVRELRGRLEVRNIRSARDRLTAWLQLHAAGSPPAVACSRPWTEVAAEIGLTREALYRALADLTRSAEITREGGRTVVLKQRAL